MIDVYGFAFVTPLDSYGLSMDARSKGAATNEKDGCRTLQNCRSAHTRGSCEIVDQYGAGFPHHKTQMKPSSRQKPSVLCSHDDSDLFTPPFKRAASRPLTSRGIFTIAIYRKMIGPFASSYRPAGEGGRRWRRMYRAVSWICWRSTLRLRRAVGL